MQKKFIKLLKKLRRRYIERHDLPQPRPLNKEMDPDIISSHIREKLLSPEPCMLSRFGAVEIGCVVNYLSNTSKGRHFPGGGKKKQCTR